MNRSVLLSGLLVLCLALQNITFADDKAPAKETEPITEIMLKRTSCYGPCPVDEVTLKPDGTAAYTGQQYTARVGQYKGAIHDYEFGPLARWIESNSFFELEESYGMANPDGANEIVSVVRGDQRKTITNHMENSPVLWGIERVILGAASDIKWEPESSGIRGNVFWEPRTSSNLQGKLTLRPALNEAVVVRRVDGKQDFRFFTDKRGTFEIPLLPGTYTIEFPINYSIEQKTTPQQTVIVQVDKFSTDNFMVHWPT